MVKRTDPSTVPLEVRFWSRVGTFNHRDPSACALWEGSITAAGYGQVTDAEGLTRYAHRVSFEISERPLRPGELVRHRCPNGPNRRCVRPCHLQVGDAKDNALDRSADKGHRETERLNAHDIVAIRYAYRCGRFSQGDLALLFTGTSENQSQIARIVQGKSHKNLPGPTVLRGRGTPPKRRRWRLR